MRIRSNGFTLIEILIVLLIISIITGVALLTINHNQKKTVTLEAEKLVRTLQLCEQKALLWPATLGLKLNFSNYTIVVLQNNHKNKWKPLPDRNIGFHAIPATMTIVLENSHTNGSQNNPQIIFFENGEITPFKILMSKKNSDPMIEIEGHANGEIEQHGYEEK